MARADRVFLPLDVNWYEDWGHTVSSDACVLWLTAACACKRLPTDGRLRVSQLRRAAPVALQASSVTFANALSELSESDEVPLILSSDVIIIPGWEKWNDTTAEIAAKAKGGEYGNHIKWHVQKGQKPKSLCIYCESSLSDIASDSVSESNRREEKRREENNTCNSATPKLRKRDELFEAMVEVCEYDPTNLPRSERGRINKALQELRELGVCPEDVRIRAANYRSKWPGIDLTPQALTGNWSKLEESQYPKTLASMTLTPGRSMFP